MLVFVFILFFLIFLVLSVLLLVILVFFVFLAMAVFIGFLIVHFFVFVDEEVCLYYRLLYWGYLASHACLDQNLLVLWTACTTRFNHCAWLYNSCNLMRCMLFCVLLLLSDTQNGFFLFIALLFHQLREDVLLLAPDLLGTAFTTLCMLTLTVLTRSEFSLDGNRMIMVGRVIRLKSVDRILDYFSVS